MILRTLLWLIRKHPDVAHVSVTRWSEVEHMHIEQHEYAYVSVWQ